jgi:hypothetical protein
MIGDWARISKTIRTLIISIIKLITTGTEDRLLLIISSGECKRDEKRKRKRLRRVKIEKGME